MIDIIRLAFRLWEKVTGFSGRAREFFYAIVLVGRECSECGGRLEMIGEGRCTCQRCGLDLDPTVAFQRCTTCGGRLALRVRRYRCPSCGVDVASRFLFDGLAFDVGYFRQKMAEHRQRKKEIRERVHRMLAESRSPSCWLPFAELVPGSDLAGALDGLVATTEDIPRWRPAEGLDLKRYQGHVQAHLRDSPVTLGGIPALGEDSRKDLVWRFVAIIFMAHAGLVDIWQEGEAIWVMKHETDREGQDIPRDLEDVDGVEGPPGRAEA